MFLFACFEFDNPYVVKVQSIIPHTIFGVQARDRLFASLHTEGGIGLTACGT